MDILKIENKEVFETYKDKVTRLNEKLDYLEKIMFVLLFLYCFFMISGFTLQLLDYLLK